MKKDIHPTYYPNAKISCVCGNSLTVGSTKENILVEICSQCHPFFTGKQRLVDSARRVEKYEEKVAKKAKVSESRKGKKIKRTARAVKKSSKELKVDESSEKKPGKKHKKDESK